MLRITTPQVLGRALVAGILGLTASAALAGGNDNLKVTAGGDVTRSVEVRISDLNLASASGQDRLTSRIADAARRACDVHSGSAIDRLPSARNCLAQARNGVLAQLDRRGITAPSRLANNDL